MMGQILGHTSDPMVLEKRFNEDKKEGRPFCLMYILTIKSTNERLIVDSNSLKKIFQIIKEKNPIIYNEINESIKSIQKIYLNTFNFIKINNHLELKEYQYKDKENEKFFYSVETILPNLSAEEIEIVEATLEGLYNIKTDNSNAENIAKNLLVISEWIKNSSNNLCHRLWCLWNAAMLNNATAQYTLGTIFYEDKNKEESKKWFELASENGIEKAKQWIEFAEKTL